MKYLILISILFITGCSQLNTKPEPSLGWFADELCTHSKEHRDLILLAISEETNGHSYKINCNCEYGMDCQGEEE